MKLNSDGEEYLKQRLTELDEAIERVKNRVVVSAQDYIISMEDQKNIIKDMLELIKSIDFNFH
jgi:hypothetical protein